MIVAAAQTKPFRYDVNSNLQDHIRLVNRAADKNADLILFPEMSLTGYEREDAKGSAFQVNDARLEELKRLSDKRRITIIAGAPIAFKEGLTIGAFIIQPDKDIMIYTKQHLHGDENLYFSTLSGFNPIIELNNERIALAICADINHTTHAENCYNSGCTLYLAGIFDTPDDTQKAHRLLSGYTKMFSLKVLMANFAGSSWGLDAGGKSAYWNKEGELVAKLDHQESGLLVIDTEHEF